MSVRGEFTRSAGLLLDFLEENHPESAELRRAIGEARDLAKENISGGAEEILALEARGALRLAVPASVSEEQEERISHLLAISRIILGK